MKLKRDMSKEELAHKDWEEKGRPRLVWSDGTKVGTHNGRPMDPSFEAKKWEGTREQLHKAKQRLENED